MADWRFALPLLFIVVFLIFEDLITAPSCVISDGGVSEGPIKLKAMIVADLLLKGSDAGYADAMFRNVFISRFFRKSYEKLEPDILVILGDIAAKRSELGKSDWPAVLQQLYRLIGPFNGVPLIVGLGERDVGECSELDEDFVAQIANSLPGLDRTGSASFSDTVETVLSELIQTLPLNETEYILQSLRPRMVFSAHRHHFNVYNHSDGTREFTVPAMTWASSSRPGFVLASFGETNTIVSHCSLAREMHVVMGYLSILVLLLAAAVISRGSYSINLFQF